MAEVNLEDVPRKAQDLFTRGLAALERNNLDYAIDLFLTLLELEPKLLQARKLLRAAEIKRLEQRPFNPVKRFFYHLFALPTMLRFSYQLNKTPHAALKNAEYILRRDPMNLSFAQLVAKASVACDLPEAAILTLEIVKERAPKEFKIWKLLAQLYLKVDRPEKAQQCFEAMARLRPNDPSVLKEIKDAAALDTMKSGGWDQADSYRDVIKDTQEAQALEQQAKSVRSEEGTDRMISELQAKIKSEPTNTTHKIRLANVYRSVGAFEDALAILEQALSDTGDTDPELDRLASEVKIEQLEKQIVQCQERGELSQADQIKAERNAFELTDIRNRVQRYPNDLELKYEYGVRLFDNGAWDEAIKQLQFAQKNLQHRIEALYFLGLCFKRKQQFDLASEQLEKASSELPGMGAMKKEIYYELGQLAELSGEREKASNLYKSIYAEDIGFKDVAQKVEELYGKSE